MAYFDHSFVHKVLPILLNRRTQIGVPLDAIYGTRDGTSLVRGGKLFDVGFLGKSLFPLLHFVIAAIGRKVTRQQNQNVRSVRPALSVVSSEQAVYLTKKQAWSGRTLEPSALIQSMSQSRTQSWRVMEFRSSTDTSSFIKSDV